LKKIKYLSLGLLLITSVANANPVTQQTAETVAANFYNQTFNTGTPNLTLAVTEYDANNQPVYYIFNVNINKGFVIVAAEDAAHPILGYSNKGNFVMPSANNNVAWWLNCRKQEIQVARTQNISAAADVATEWFGYLNNRRPNQHRVMSFVNPLLSSTWNQSPYYNDMCPGGSVTGCVATAMAQIMRYWQYPSHGHGSSSYFDMQIYGYQQSYGQLSADYDTSNYVWSSMPLNLSGPNSQVAQLMYDCGVSVCMDYSPGGSGAWVIDGDYPICAQNSYVKYFAYNPATIQGVYKSNYTANNWLALIENELNNGRPVQYVGFDSTANAGHTWVCDGYDNSGNFDMNWGWGGADNGYYAANALFVGYNFDWWDEAVIGIEPPATSPYFAGTPTFGCSGLLVNYTDMSVANAAITSRKWLFPGGNPATSNATNPSVTYNNSGAYDVSEIVSDVNGTDTLVMKSYVSVATTAALPLAQTFQSVTFPPAGWANYNPTNSNYVWQQYNGVGGYGSSNQCMYFDNAQAYGAANALTNSWKNGKVPLEILGQKQRIYTPEYDFTWVGNPLVYFDVAYAPFNNQYSDTLNIYYSTDCGATFHQVYSKGGMTLGTTGNTVQTGADTNSVGIFTPKSTDWRTDTIKIPAIVNATHVMFAFENVSGNGSPIYIDNLNMPIALGIGNVNNFYSVNLYPNPNTGKFTFQVEGYQPTTNGTLEIYNSLGEMIYNNNLVYATNQVDLSDKASGIYLYRALSHTGELISTGRFIIQ